MPGKSKYFTKAVEVSSTQTFRGLLYKNQYISPGKNQMLQLY